MKVLFFTNIPSPYRMCFFGKLANYMDLVVGVERLNAADREDKWLSKESEGFALHRIPSIAIGNESSIGIATGVIKKEKADFIIFDGYSSPTAILSIIYCIIKKIPYAISIDGAIDNNTTGIKKSLKKFLIKNATAWLSPCMKGNEILVKYGADSKRIYWYPFTSMTADEILQCSLSAEQKMHIRETLNLPTDRKILISVGRFSKQHAYRKGFDVLLKVAKLIDPQIMIYIIGDEPTDEYKKKIEDDNIKNVEFIGFMKSNELYKYFQAADLSVLLTREDIWGLVVNESLANGCPVITTYMCGAGLELIKDGYNGYLVKNLEDPQGIGNLIETTISDEKKLSKMSENSIESIQHYSIEEMVEKHVEALTSILGR